MFKLRNKAGNVYKVATTEHRRDELLAQGYRLVEEDAPDEQAAPAKPVEEMTVPELKAYAEANGFDLAGATRKDEILAKILGAKKTNGEE